MARSGDFKRIAFFALVACGNSNKPAVDAAPAKDVGFNKPTAALHANKQVGHCSVTTGTTCSVAGDCPNTEQCTNLVWTDQGPADLACLGTTSGDAATAVTVTFSTTVKDFQSGNLVSGVKVIAFDNSDTSTMFDTQTSDANGAITFTIPTGHKRVGFKMTDTATPPSIMPTFLLNQYFDPNTAAQTSPNKIQSVSNATAQTLPALIGETRVPGTGVIAGALRDCSHHEMSNFIATVSSVSGTATPLTGAEAYYFSSAVDLPVHHTQQDASSGDGLFMVIQLPAAPTAFVQMWGFKNDADVASGTLTQIAELQVPVLADTVITGSYEPLRR
jgi:hypothetical protein